MDTIKEIVEQLPYIMTYFVEGYLFVSIYKFVAFKKYDSDTKNLFLKCVVSSYVIKSIFDYILSHRGIKIDSDASYILLLCLLSTILGYFSGKIMTSKCFQNFLSKVGIKRTPNDRVWDDVLLEKQECWVCLQSPKYENLQYLGLYQYCEEFEREPLISLSHYQVLDMEGNILDDQSQSGNIILLNTKNFEKIEIIYGDKLDFLSKLKRKFCVGNKNTVKKSNKSE